MYHLVQFATFSPYLAMRANSCFRIVLQKRKSRWCGVTRTRVQLLMTPVGVNAFWNKRSRSCFTDAGETAKLTPQKVSSILRRNEKVVVENREAVESYVLNQLQANNPIEDRIAIGRLEYGGAALFGVFDGHVGSDCAQALSDRLFDYIGVARADRKVLKEIGRGMIDPAKDLVHYRNKADRLVNSYQDTQHRKRLIALASEQLSVSESKMSIEDSLIHAFLSFDRDIVLGALPANAEKSGMNKNYSDALKTALTGAVACVAYIDGTDLFVANVGDSQGILGVHNENSWDTVHLSHVHDADNAAEVERISKNHPNESSNIIKNGRLFGNLIPLRAFGDACYKWKRADLRKLQHIEHIPEHLVRAFGNHFLPPKYHTPPYLDAEPEVIHHKLTPKDKFLVLATDGLWDFLCPGEVVRFVADQVDDQRSPVHYATAKTATLKDVKGVPKWRSASKTGQTLDSNAATHLLRKALGPDHDQLSAQLTLPQSSVRSYRDDISIIVIFFNSEDIRGKIMHQS